MKKECHPATAFPVKHDDYLPPIVPASFAEVLPLPEDTAVEFFCLA